MKRTVLLILCLLFLPVAAHAGKLGFLGFDGNFWQVFTIGDEGGGTTKLTTTPFDKTNISIDRKNKRLLYSTNTGHIFLHDIASGKAVKLAVGLEGMTDAVLSPTGEHVAFSLSTTNSVDTNDIWVYHVKSQKLRKLTNEKGLQHRPAWSPDGRQLLFLGGEGPPSHDIFVIDIGGKSMAQLTAGNLYHFGANLSVNGEVVFSSNRQGSYDIYTMSLTGENVQRLTSEPSFEGEPSWSPDGSKIVYVSTQTGKRQLYIINRDGSGKRMIPTELSARNPIWLE
jgi:TolB protein